MVNTLYYPYQVGGAEKVVQLLAEGLLQAGQDVFVISLNKPPELLKQEIVNGVRVYRIPLQNIYWPFDNSRRKPNAILRAFWHCLDIYNKPMKDTVYEILQIEQPDVVHTHNLVGFSVATWSAVKALRFPLLHTLHDHSLICIRTTMYKKGQNCFVPCGVCNLFSKIKRISSRKVDLVVGVSQYILRKHMELNFFPQSDYDFIYNAVSKMSEVLSNKLKDEGNFCIGFLGRLDPSKGVEDVIQVVRKLRKELPVKLFIAGTGDKEYERMLREKAKGLPVEFLGHVAPEDLFRSIHCLVVPSRCHESFGLVIIESYAFGIPVIGAARGGIPEIIDEGKTGWLYDPDIPGDLERVIIKAFANKDEIDEIGQQGQRKAEDFTIEKYVLKYLACYTKLSGRT